jgi:hypothetical protein
MEAELDKPFASATVNVTVAVPGMVGMPLIVPLVERVRPGGSAPLLIDQL